MNKQETEYLTLPEALHKYVDLTMWIREMSTPRLDEVPNAEEYRGLLLHSFLRIGELARRNTEILETYLFPLLNKEALAKEEIDVLYGFLAEMLDDRKMENLDLPLILRITKCLLDDARGKKEKDPDGFIRALDQFISASYMIIEMSARFADCNDACTRYSQAGIAAWEEMRAYLDPDAFLTLLEESRCLVLINASYAHALYLTPALKNDTVKKESLLQMLRDAYALKDDPSLKTHATGYDWMLHEYRTLQYLSNLTDFHNRHGFNEAQLSELLAYSEQYHDLHMAHEDIFTSATPTDYVKQALVRNRYLAGKMNVEAYRRELLRFIHATQESEFSYNTNTILFTLPVEYILTLDKEHLSVEQAAQITSFYKDMSAYIHRMPKLGNLTFLLTDLTHVIETFVDLPGGVGFEEFCLELLAAVHPPTYIHSLSVANIAAVLTRQLCYTEPQLLQNVPGYPDVESVCEYARHAGLCHDYGKLFLVETIMTYGRNLFEEEYEWIHAHPQIGAQMLSRFDDTKGYAAIALGHHEWHNDKGGYPPGQPLSEQPLQTLIEIVTCADSMDAATDDVGRSYKRGKLLDDVAREVVAGSGTQYASFLVPLLQDKQVHEELERILSLGRDENYLRTYHLLAHVIRLTPPQRT